MAVQWLSAIGGAIIKPLAGVVNKRTERKINKDTIRGKLAAQKQGDEAKIELNDAEWETVAQAMQDKSWKDEYVTVSVVSVFNLLILGGVMAAFGYPEVLQGTERGIQALTDAGVDLGYLMLAVVLAAIGLKLWRA